MHTGKHDHSGSSILMDTVYDIVFTCYLLEAAGAVQIRTHIVSQHYTMCIHLLKITCPDHSLLKDRPKTL